MFCKGFIKTHGTFHCDLQNSFEENAKDMRYCNAKLNVISDVLRDGVCGLSKTITNWQVYCQLNFEYVCMNRYQAMRKVHIFF